MDSSISLAVGHCSDRSLETPTDPGVCLRFQIPVSYGHEWTWASIHSVTFKRDLTLVSDGTFQFSATSLTCLSFFYFSLPVAQIPCLNV